MAKTKEKKPRGRKGESFNIWIPKEHKATFDALMKRNKRTRVAEFLAMLEDYASRAGLWPPQNKSQKNGD